MPLRRFLHSTRGDLTFGLEVGLMTGNQVRLPIGRPRPQEEAMQPSLFDVLEVPAEKLKYEAFKEANPWVIERLTKMC